MGVLQNQYSSDSMVQPIHQMLIRKFISNPGYHQCIACYVHLSLLRPTSTLEIRIAAVPAGFIQFRIVLHRSAVMIARPICICSAPLPPRCLQCTLRHSTRELLLSKQPSIRNRFLWIKIIRIPIRNRLLWIKAVRISIRRSLLCIRPSQILVFGPRPSILRCILSRQSHCTQPRVSQSSLTTYAYRHYHS